MSFHLLHKRIQKAIQDTGYNKPTPIQERAIPKIFSGADVIGIAQTGTGKTAAFTLPLLSKLAQSTEAKEVRCSQVLIIAPTRELVTQIHENTKVYSKYTNIRTAAIHGGVSEKGQIDKLNTGVDMIIATPGRFLDLTERGHGKLHNLQTLVLDEADRMLDMGFIPEVRKICKKLPKSRQTLLFSATMNSQIEAVTKEFLNSPSFIEVGRRANPAATVTQFIYEVLEHQKKDLLIHLLNSSHDYYTVIIFVRTRDGAEILNRALKDCKIDSAAIHGDKKQGQRRKALKDFKEGRIRALVATDIAARGIDISGVTHVINYDFPEHSEDYVHRIGRTGRAAASGEAITFSTPNNQLALKKLEKLIRRTLPRMKASGFVYDDAPLPNTQIRRKPRHKKNSAPSFHTPSKFSSKNKPKRATRKKNIRPIAKAKFRNRKKSDN